MHKPNIVFISVDTLRADHLSCYGYFRKTSPNLDRVAAEGVLFKSACSTAAWTPPAHASMFTGLYPSQHGVVDEYRLDAKIPTIAEILSAQGYRTAGFINNSMVGQLVGLNRGHQYFDEVWMGAQYSNILSRGLGFLGRKVQAWSGKNDEGAGTTNRRVLNWLQAERTGDAPFYLFIHYIDVHNPMKAPKPYRYSFLDDVRRRKVDMRKIWKVAENPLICLTDKMALNEDEREALKCIYDEEIAYVDFRIGEILHYLQCTNLLENTFLIITADHGEHFGEHGLYSHVSSLYEPVLHIPLLVRYPRILPRGVESGKPVQLVDVLPTLLELLDLPYPGEMTLRGESLLDPDARERSVFAEWEGRVPHFVKNRLGANARPEDLRFYTSAQTMIRTGRHKLIQREGSPGEVYDLLADPDEETNLASRIPELAGELQQKLHDWQISVRTVKERELYELNNEVRRNLEGLGYL